jgi:uncharacterized protein (TIGR02687 family)
MSTAKIQNALEKEFARKRLVFWYDPDLIGWQIEFEAVQLPGVVKIAVQNSEFSVKHRIAREEPQQKFLLYFRGQAQPPDTQNWLLDQLLACGPAFSPDRASLALIDAGLPPEFKTLTAQHIEFFRNAERVSKLKEWLKPDDTESDVQLKMTAVACRTEPTVEGIQLALLGELARDKNDRWAQVEKFALAGLWWKQLAAHFGYVTTTPALLDFVLSLFRAVTPLGASSSLDPRQALVFLNRWKDSEEYRTAFEMLSERADGLLNVSGALNQVEDVRPLLTHETYRRIDLKILADLRDGLVNSTLPPAETRQRAEARAQLHWARHDKGVQSLYRALGVAAEFVEALPKIDLTVESFNAGLDKYATTWWRMDQLYRQFIFHFTDSGQTALLEQLASRIEGLYVNEFLSKLAQRWQEWLDRCPQWLSTTMPSQRELVSRFVQPQLAEGRKVFVIVSDALRYEAGRALLERILREDRWTAEIRSVLGVLPSFTQLGMAALLPHKSLEFDTRGQTILADGNSTAGTKARGDILAARFGGKGAAISAEDFLALNSKTDGRDFSRANDVVFVFHNIIDAVGDKRDTEHKTCAAVEDAIEDIVRLLKKAAAMNVSHFIVTADHGFLYQHEPVAESDFLAIPEPPGTLQYQRRFIVAPAIPDDPRLRRFTSNELRLGGSLAIAIPKGIQRLRLQGSGSRYVHGGASLQEVVLPVLDVKKERASDIGRVDLDIVRSGQQITTGQVTITFLQRDPVGEKCLPRELRAGFVSRTGIAISEAKSLTFDSTAEDARQRERREQFVFGREADQFNQQEVVLRLEEQIPGTAQFSMYREFTFKLRRAFESDFDDL